MMLVLGSLLVALVAGFVGGVLWTLRWFGAIVLALVTVSAGAQPIDGWTEYQAPRFDPYVALEADGSLVVRIHGYSPMAGENVSHLIRSGPATDAARVEMVFSGDTSPSCAEPNAFPVCGWSHVMSGGGGGCAPGNPPIAADETYILTVRDHGDRWVGLFVGNPYPIHAPWEKAPPGEGVDFATIGIIEAIGDGRYVVRAIVVTAPIWMYSVIRASLDVSGNLAVGVVSFDGLVYGTSAVVSVTEPGPLGLIAVTTPRSLCTDGPWREFTTLSVEAK